MVMALTVLGLAMSSPVEIEQAEAVSISFPDFAATLRELGAEIEERATDLRDPQAT